MSNSKRFLSVILAMIMICSTLVVGASAAYTAYKDSAIVGQYNDLDKPVLTTEQYASAAMDEVDRMLDKEQIKFTRADIMVGDVDITSVDATMDSVYSLVTGRLWSTFSGMLGDLKNLNVSAFKPESEGGVRRGTTGKTDKDIIYAVLQFLYDNKNIFVSYINGTIDLGSILPSLVDISKFQDVSKMLKGMLYEETYKTDAPADMSGITYDGIVQDLVTAKITKFVPELSGHTDISSGSMYQFIDYALKVLYNKYGVSVLNHRVKEAIGKYLGVVYTKDEQGVTIDVDASNLNSYARLLNYDYVVPTYTFTSGTFIDNLNNIIKSIADVVIKPEIFTWQSGNNSMLLTNITNLAKAALCNTGSDFFASYIDVASPAEVNAMSSEELCAYALRATINGSVDGMYIPDDATTLREFGYYTLGELLATSVPELDFSSLDKNSTDTLIIMGIDYAIYSVNAALDMDLEYVYTMDGVDKQINKAMKYAIDNYGGLFNGITFDTSANASGWDNLNTLLFSIIAPSWLPSQYSGNFKTFLIDGIINNILNLNLTGLLEMFAFHSGSELQSSPKQVALNLVRRVVNIIFPGAIAQASTIDALASNSALASTVNAIFSDLYNYRVQLTASILPTVCNILDLTNEQEFKFPSITCDELISDSSGSPDYSIKIRNSSSGINTGYTDANGTFHQDSLYTYQILSVTSNVSTINLTNPGTIPGGREAVIRVTGSFSTDTVFVVAITYNVLTEDGSTLTSEPITEYIYSYLSTSSNDSETKFTASSGSLSITDGALNLYASSMSDLYRLQLTVENSSSTKYTDLLPTSTGLNYLMTDDAAYTKTFEEVDEETGETTTDTVTIPANTCYLQLKTEPSTLLPKVEDSNGIAKIYVFETTSAYDALTNHEKEAVWESMILRGTTNRQLCKYTVTTGATAGGVTATNTKNNIFLYKDYDLDSLLTREMGRHRQASGYSSSSAWTAYTTAMAEAAKAVYSPFKAATFASKSATNGKAVLYESAYNDLIAAIEDLDATAISAGVASTQAIIDSVNPSNEGKNYYDSDYNFFAVADFKDYTYYNYRTEYREAQRMIDAATIPDETTGEVEAVNALSLAYINHRLSLYASRLVPVAANKQHLVKALAQCVPMSKQSEYSAESWANYITAYNFAVATNNDSSASLKQSKVNTAYEELLEAEKRLVAPSEGGDASFTLVNPAGGTAPEAVETAEGKAILNVDGLDNFEAAEYFNCTGCSVTAELTDAGSLGTGAKITVTDDSTGSVLAQYTVVVFGDADGTASADSYDMSSLLVVNLGSSEFDSFQTLAMDLTSDDSIDGYDITEMLKVLSGVAAIDYIARTIA